jgi:hypothetical protein
VAAEAVGAAVATFSTVSKAATVTPAEAKATVFVLGMGFLHRRVNRRAGRP